MNFHGTFPWNSMEISSSISVEFHEKVQCNSMETTPSNAMDPGSSMEFTGIRPVSNIALLPCRAQKNLTRQLHGNSIVVVSNVEFNSVSSHQIQHKENVAIKRSQAQ